MDKLGFGFGDSLCTCKLWIQVCLSLFNTQTTRFRLSAEICIYYLTVFHSNLVDEFETQMQKWQNEDGCDWLAGHLIQQLSKY